MHNDSCASNTQIQNLIPMKYVHTTPTAGPIIRIVTALIMELVDIFGSLTVKKLSVKGDVYLELEHVSEADTNKKDEKVPNWILSFIPLLVVVVLLNILTTP